MNKNPERSALSVEARTAILERYAVRYLKIGYVVEQRTRTSMRLVKAKKFNFGWALAWFLLFGVGLIVYALYYICKDDAKVVDLSVDRLGDVAKVNH